MNMKQFQDGQDYSNLSATQALERILKLDRKFTTFNYCDTLRNVNFQVQNPSVMNDYHNGEHLLRLFWIQIANAYFRRLTHKQTDRLIYFQDLINQEFHDELFEQCQQFWMHFNTVFIRDKAEKICGWGGESDYKNWISTLYIYYCNFLQDKSNKRVKKLDRELRELTSIRNNLKFQHNNSKRTLQSLQAESISLSNYLPDPVQDELADELKDMIKDLQLHHRKTEKLFNELKERVSYELGDGNSYFCFGQKYDEQELVFMGNDGKMENEQKVMNDKLQEIDLQLRYFQYLITSLDKKQIAQSISKVQRVDKSRGDHKFTVIFEEAMNKPKTIIHESELVLLNSKRQYSLFGFYNTSLKTPYSFISQNIYGFGQIYRHRLEPGKNRKENMLKDLKLAQNTEEEICREMKKFDICHHCKYLYPQMFLTKCKYNSQKLGKPIESAAYGDPYLNQMSKFDASKASRYSMRKRNTCFNYTKIGEQFCCNRKFCKTCLKQNYIDGFDRNGLCPFCQGICFCTRCSRNQMIIKLKSLYFLLGGQMSNLENSRRINVEQNNQNFTEKTNKKGRPKKITGHIDAPPKIIEHMNTIRIQLQPLRLLSDMVKKREKTKLKVIQSEQDTFISKIGVMDGDFNNWSKSNGMTLDSSGQNDSGSLILQKKDKIGINTRDQKKKREVHKSHF